MRAVILSVFWLVLQGMQPRGKCSFIVQWTAWILLHHVPIFSHCQPPSTLVSRISPCKHAQVSSWWQTFSLWPCYPTCNCTHSTPCGIPPWALLNPLVWKPPRSSFKVLLSLKSPKTSNNLNLSSPLKFSSQLSVFVSDTWWNMQGQDAMRPGICCKTFQ